MKILAFRTVVYQLTLLSASLYAAIIRQIAYRYLTPYPPGPVCMGVQ